jgi:hypothetical protein
VTGPDELRARFAGHTPAALVGAIAVLRPRAETCPAQDYAMASELYSR